MSMKNPKPFGSGKSLGERMPHSAAELEYFIREITTEILRDNDLLHCTGPGGSA